MPHANPNGWRILGALALVAQVVGPLYALALGAGALAPGAAPYLVAPHVLLAVAGLWSLRAPEPRAAFRVAGLATATLLYALYRLRHGLLLSTAVGPDTAAGFDLVGYHASLWVVAVLGVAVCAPSIRWGPRGSPRRVRAVAAAHLVVIVFATTTQAGYLAAGVPVPAGVAGVLAVAFVWLVVFVPWSAYVLATGRPRDPAFSIVSAVNAAVVAAAVYGTVQELNHLYP